MRSTVTLGILAILCLLGPAVSPAWTQGLLFDNLVLVDEVNCGDPNDPHTLTQSASGVSQIQTILGQPCRVLLPGTSDRYFSYRLGQNMGLQAGKAYILVIEYPEDQPRSMWIINSGCEQTNGIHTGNTVGDALDPPYVNSNAESLNWPLSGKYEVAQMFFHLHHRYPNITENRGSMTYPLVPSNGIPVTIAQFKSAQDPTSLGAAVKRIALYEAPDFATYSLPINFPPDGLPRRHLFWREEMSDSVIGSSTASQRATPTDTEWYEYKARLHKFLGMNTFSKDLLEFGHNQGWDSSPYGGTNWVNQSSTPQRWSNMLDMLGNYDLDVMPYYEYAGSIGSGSLAMGSKKLCLPLARAQPYTQVDWSEKAYCQVVNPLFETDVDQILDCTITRLKNKVNFIGAWFRTRNSNMPADFSDYALAKFATEANGGVAVTRAQISGSTALYNDYMAWWKGKRQAYLNHIRDYLRTNVNPEANVLFTWDSSEAGISYPSWTSTIISNDASYWAGKGKTAISLANAISTHRQLNAMTLPVLTYSGWEWQHSVPSPDPYNYTNSDGVLLTHSYNKAYTVSDPASMEAFTTSSGLAMIRHYMLNEDALANVGYFVGDMNLAGPFAMMPEALAMANGDPRYIGYLASSSYNRVFPDYVRNFNQAFLSLPALPSVKVTGLTNDPNIVVRRIDTDGYGTYLALINVSTATTNGAIVLTLPVAGNVINAATGAPMENMGGLVVMAPFYPYEMRTVRIFSGSDNMSPVVDAGSDQTITTPQNTVNLAGSATDDGNPDPPGQLTLAWSKVSGPGTVTFDDPAAAATTATFSAPGVYVLRLTADDGQFVIFDEVTITYNAVPHLNYTATDLGSGLTGYAFIIGNNDGLLQSYALTVAFEATGTASIRQMKAFGAVRVDREEDATTYGAMPAANFVKAEDTWVFSPFSNNGIPGVSPIDGTTFTGFVEGPNNAYYMISAGSGSGSTLGDNVSAVYVVSDGNVSWTGVLARAGTSYAVSGQTETVVVLIPGDYNGDGVVDLADYTIWADNYGQTGSNIPGDGNNDGVVDLADYTVWADHYGQGTPPAMTAEDEDTPTGAVVYGNAVSGGAAEGDFNGDGYVNAADYTLWADGDASADANGDGVVDLADYTIWADQVSR